MTRTRPTTSSRRNKTLAILAGGTLVGVAVTATLAAWTDTEWIFGGDGAGGPGIGTSTFEVVQNTAAPFTDPEDFVNEEENPGGEMTFELAALDLSPGDEVYAGVSLQTTDTSISGDVELQPAIPADGIVQNDPDGLLYGALDVRVATADTAFACEADAFLAGAGTEIIADGDLDSAAATAEQTLAAEAGSTQFYCFEVSLPDDVTVPTGFDLDDLMGLTLAPAWEFASESV
ncbi:SipW-dependent-type signal peptide-containing protein [Labedella endophytica]|uniref:Acyl-CoA dehydrogenase n=1 Tax=Labedella endophytica TaxID=1523160 RepID=A0A433JMP2_9MICO|nr:SipW-dependent-type signal peptide-containing protein [Labedella endophytica]RUQ96930.1 acyl-CoA dehydrogenase [Labedella endophytica]